MFYYEDSMLDELKSAMFDSNNDNVFIDKENRTVNFNECGDAYYSIHTYTNDVVKSILICAKNDGVSAFVEIFAEEDDRNIYDIIDKILERNDELEEILTRKFEEEFRRKRESEKN